MLNIDKKTYKVENKNYYHTKIKKTQIILGASLRKDSNNIIRLKHKDFGQSKKWPTFTISRDGSIFQHFDPVYYSDYVNFRAIDRQSISIEFENMGNLIYDYDKEYFVNWINEVCPNDNVYEKVWKNNRYWEKFTDHQMNSAVKLIDHLLNEFDITRDGYSENVFEEHAAVMNGIMSRSNINSDFNDISPAFDLKKLFKKLNIAIV